MSWEIVSDTKDDRTVKYIRVVVYVHYVFDDYDTNYSPFFGIGQGTFRPFGDRLVRPDVSRSRLHQEFVICSGAGDSSPTPHERTARDL